MFKIASAITFVGLLLVAAVTPAAAISIFSTSNAANSALTCTSGATSCGAATNVFILNPTLPAPPWTPSDPFNSSAQWISYNATTSQDASGTLNTSLAAPSVTINYNLGIISADTPLTLHVWADDTAAVRINNGIGTLATPDPLATYAACASSGITCGGPGTLLSLTLPANASAYTISFDLFQRGGDGTPFGLLFDGVLDTPTATPEPATILLLGSALTAAGVISRRRWRKTP
jgi:hypothetical protein